LTSDLVSLKANLFDQNEALGRMIKKGFDGVDRQLAEIVKILDVRRIVEEHERKIAKLEAALNVKL